MKTSELFMDIICDGGTPCITCQFCGRTHFTHEEESKELAKLREKAAKEPDKYIESDNDSIGFGYLDGKQYVWNCPCDSGARYEEFIWLHRSLIARYLKKRAAQNLERAVRDAECTSAIPE